MLPLQITQRKKCTFPRSWHMCLFTETYLYNTSNKTNSTSGNQGVDVTSISFPKFHEGEGKKKKQIATGSLVFKVHRTIQEQVKVSQQMPIHSPGRRCHAIWHSRPVKDVLLRINAEQRASLFLSLSCAKPQGHKCLR